MEEVAEDYPPGACLLKSSTPVPTSNGMTSNEHRPTRPSAGRNTRPPFDTVRPKLLLDMNLSPGWASLLPG